MYLSRRRMAVFLYSSTIIMSMYFYLYLKNVACFLTYYNYGSLIYGVWLIYFLYSDIRNCASYAFMFPLFKLSAWSECVCHWRILCSITGSNPWYIYIYIFVWCVLDCFNLLRFISVGGGKNIHVPALVTRLWMCGLKVAKYIDGVRLWYFLQILVLLFLVDGFITNSYDIRSARLGIWKLNGVMDETKSGVRVFIYSSCLWLLWFLLSSVFTIIEIIVIHGQFLLISHSQTLGGWKSFYSVVVRICIILSLMMY